jgi:ketopantoate reductase
MFARELQGVSDIVGIGRSSEAEMIARGGLKVIRGEAAAETLRVEAIGAEDFAHSIGSKYPDFIWLAVRNPVTEAVKSYYRNFSGKEKMPALILSQNGLSAVGDAQAALGEVLGQDASRVNIIRVSLINGVDAEFGGAAFVPCSGTTAGQSRTFKISYKLPIKLGFGFRGGGDEPSLARSLAEIFKAAGFKAEEFCGQDVAKMENSKLFTNLIGVAAAVGGVPADQGLRDKKIFEREVLMLREVVRAVKASGGGFVASFCGYPIRFLTWLMLLPVWMLMPFRGIFADIVAKGRNRPKDLTEIDYYNGEVVRMGRNSNVGTPVNDELVLSAKQLVSRSAKTK